VLTLASPHQRPLGTPQPSLARFYRRLARARTHPVPVVSIAGGWRDVQARCAARHPHRLACNGWGSSDVSAQQCTSAVVGCWLALLPRYAVYPLQSLRIMLL